MFAKGASSAHRADVGKIGRALGAVGALGMIVSLFLPAYPTHGVSDGTHCLAWPQQSAEHRC